MRDNERIELPTRKRNRLAEYDYSMPNAYFITICTDKRKNLFWTDTRANAAQLPDIPLTYLGHIVKQSVLAIPKHYPSISVENYVIMPNHVHLLLQIHTDSHGRSMIAPTISTVIRLMKGAVSKQVGFAIWQKGFHDHVVRNDKDYQEVWNYIERNPAKWEEDKLCVCLR